ncbi:MaoC family dehydratase [Pseudomonas sp. ADAK18]|uniref:MaoC family dehydratase n=1 Tax=Pseudomonas sp. ADAK18 TaxID=2730848 RepID=UPI001463464F|nr:MaoC family dehydratase [Pseudomonas sp. ADAK18]QJI29871.1 MaoC family dehydratase [Pseudomonas sp. ADAK18]
MQLQFGAEQIEAWAGLSGDRNPIHFDREAARRMDAADVVVHGMLALLPIKHHMGRVNQVLPQEWMQFKALLKAPVLRDSPVALSTRERSNSTGFKLHSSAGDSEHVIGHVRTVEAPVWLSTTPGFLLARDEVTAWLAQFRDEVGKGLDDWVALDALIFSHFIRNHLGVIFDCLSPQFRQQKRPNRLEDLSDHLVVQTSHQITFCTSLRSLDELQTDIRCEIDNITLIESPGKAVGTLDLGVHVNDCHVMTITLGLMAKTLSTHQGAVQ